MVDPGLVRRFAAAALDAGSEVLETREGETAAEAVLGILHAEKIETAAAGPGTPDFGSRLRIVRPGFAEEFTTVEAGIVRADYGASETGTLVRLDREDSEKLIWTLPPLCICLLDTATIVPGLDTLAPVLAGHLSRTGIPGPQVSLVTGPSRTADIEGELTIGVQGPSRLVVVLFRRTDF